MNEIARIISNISKLYLLSVNHNGREHFECLLIIWSLTGETAPLAFNFFARVNDRVLSVAFLGRCA